MTEPRDAAAAMALARQRISLAAAYRHLRHAIRCLERGDSGARDDVERIKAQIAEQRARMTSGGAR